MEYSQIKEIMKDMENSSLAELSIEFPDGTKVSLKNAKEEPVKTAYVQSVLEEAKMEKVASIEVNPKVEDDSKIVTSPMVGTFYAKSSPNADPFVEVRKCYKKRRYSLYN